jgi:UDP-3-O-[3-hydroxymyristoyl] glucosamine N-acyltransferase
MQFLEFLDRLGEAAIENSWKSGLDVNPDLTGITAIESAQPATVSYIEGGKFAKYVATTTAAALILPCQPDLQAIASERKIAWIAADDPRLVFAQAIAVFYQPFRPKPDIHPSAVIDPSVEIGEEVYIGAHAVIQAHAKIGNQAVIHPNVVVYPQVEIGDRTVLHANCTIHERSHIGADCVIHSGAVIGSEGFGFVPSAAGWVKMEQSGRTVLEDGVEIGCHSAVDRPSVGETRVGKNTKVDNLVQIAHGCVIGANCALSGQVGLAGGVTLGQGVILAGQVGVANRAHIGDRAIATAQTGLHSDVPAGQIVSGSPAIPNRDWLKTVAVYNRLPEINQSIRQLQRQVANLQAQLDGSIRD